MTPERAASLVDRWVRLYTRDLPAAVAQRRAGEIEADLHDHIEHERARGAGDYSSLEVSAKLTASTTQRPG